MSLGDFLYWLFDLTRSIHFSTPLNDYPSLCKRVKCNITTLMSASEFDQRLQEDREEKSVRVLQFFQEHEKTVTIKEGREENIMKNWTEK